MAFGSAEAGYTIFANGIGSLAFGRALTADIEATAHNSWQFGEGSNTTAGCLQVGPGGFQARVGGAIGARSSSITLGAAATTMAVTSSFHDVTGNATPATLATITGGFNGMRLVLLFADGNVTITDDNSHAADSVDLSAAFTSADDTTLELIYDGTSWYELHRSAN